MGLENIQNLKQLNQILNDTAAEGNDKAVKVSWGSRDFELIGSDKGNRIQAKMSDIVDTFARLAEKDPDKHLVGDIHDRIFELNSAGEKKLSKEGGDWAVRLRNLKTFFFRSHSAKNDKIESKYLSKAAKDLAKTILDKFNNYNETIIKLTAKADELYDGSSRTMNLLKNHNIDALIDEPEESTEDSLSDLESLTLDQAESGRDGYSTELLEDIYDESKIPKPRNDTKDAIRYIVQDKPEQALTIIENLKRGLGLMAKDPHAPQEFIQSIQHFLKVQEDEIYSTTKLERPIEEGSVNTFVEAENVEIAQTESEDSVLEDENSLERIALEDEIKKFKIQDKKFGNYEIDGNNYTQAQAKNYFNEKYKNIPLQEKLLLFIRYGNSDAMNLLLQSIKPGDKILDTPIKIDSNFTMTPLGFAMKEGKWNAFYSLLGKGAKAATIKEGSKEMHFSTQDYVKNEQMILIQDEDQTRT